MTRLFSNGLTKKATAFLAAIFLVLTLVPFGASAKNTNPSQIVKPDGAGGETWYDDVGNVVTDKSKAWVTVSKTIEETGIENEFRINLDVKTRMDVSTSLVSSNASAVLVLDMSGSMYFCATCGGGTNGNLGNHKAGCAHYKDLATRPITTEQTRYYAVREAAKDFIDTFCGNDESLDRYVAIVVFGSSGVAQVINERYWNNVAQTDVKVAVKAYLDGLTAFTNNDNGAVDGFYTNIEGGLAVARNLYINNTAAGNELAQTSNYRYLPNATITNNNVVLFTDGAANRGGSGGHYAPANTALTLQANYNATVSWTTLRANEIKQIAGQTASNRHIASLYGIVYGEAQRHEMIIVCDNTNVIDASTGNVDLSDTFKSISRNITTYADAWIVKDPMGENMVWDMNNTLTTTQSFDSVINTFQWDLKASTGTKLTSGQWEDWYQYSYSYTVTLDNLSGYTAGTENPTNKRTTLDYYIVIQEDAQTPVVGNLVTADFMIPSVFGFAGCFSFVKVDTAKNLLKDVKFQMYLGTGDGKTPYGLEITSRTDGTVDFGKLPSGHVYTLIETYAPSGVVQDTTEYVLTISYGKLTYTPDNGNLINKSGSFIFINDLDEAAIEIVKTSDVANGTIDSIDPRANYTLTVTNTGYQPLINVVVTDTLSSASESITLGSVMLNGSDLTENTDYTISDKDENGFTITFSNFTGANPFMPDDVITIEYEVVYRQQIANDTTPANTERNNIATVSAVSTVDAESVEDASEIEAEQPSLTRKATITKEVYSINGNTNLSGTWLTNANGKYIVENGDTIVYRVTVTNTGDLLLILTDIADTLTGIVLCNEDGTITGELPSTTGELQDSPRVVYFKLTVSGEDDGAFINNTAKASFTEYTEISDDETVQVAAPKIELEKEITTSTDNSYNGTPLFSHGADITFSITITNTGSATANGPLSDILSRAGFPEFVSPDIEFLDINDDPLGPSASIVIPAGESVIVHYTIKAAGQTVSGFEAAVNAAKLAVEDAYNAYQAAIGAAQQDVINAQQALSDALNALDDAETELAQKQYAYDIASAPVEVVIDILDDENNTIGSETVIQTPAAESELTALTAAQTALSDAQAAVANAQAALNSANETFNNLINDGDLFPVAGGPGSIAAAEENFNQILAGGATEVYEYQNYATYLNASDSVDFAVDYDRQSFLTLNKQVSLDGNNWSKFVAADNDSMLKFRIIISNAGTTASEPAVLKDVFGTFDGYGNIDIPSIPAGDSITVLIDKDGFTVAGNAKVSISWGGIVSNDSYTIDKFVTNTATLYIEDDAAASSSASVVIPKLPAARLSIEKLVRIAGSGDDYKKSAVAVANAPVAFEFQVTITNSGNAPATVELNDYFAGNPGVSLVDELNGDITGGYVTIPARANGVNGSVVLTMTTTLESGHSETNIAEYFTQAPDVINQSGSSTAHVKVIEAPHSILEVEKKVYNGDSFEDSATFYVTEGTTRDVIFRIIVTNTGTATGQFRMIDAFDGTTLDINDFYLDVSFSNKLADATFSHSDGNGGYYLTVLPDNSVTIYYKAQSLASRENAFINNVQIIPDRGENNGDVNVFDVIKDDEKDLSKDNANVTINEKTKVSATIGINKQIALATGYDDPADIPESAWNESLSTTANSVAVYYRISVRLISGNYSVAGTMSDETLGLTWDYSVTPNEPLFVVYTGTVTLTGVGTHSNTVIIDSAEITDSIPNDTDTSVITNPGRSTATVVISTNSYNDDPLYGSLTLSKGFSGVTPPADWDATFTITGPNNYSATYSYSQLPVTLNGLNPGSYTVSETNQSVIPGYTFISAEGIGSYVVRVSNTVAATIVNTYTISEEIITEDFPSIDIYDDDTPLAMLPSEEDDLIDIEEDDTPLTELPQTGASTTFIPLAAAGFGILGAGLLIKGKKNEEN